MSNITTTHVCDDDEELVEEEVTAVNPCLIFSVSPAISFSST